MSTVRSRPELRATRAKRAAEAVAEAIANPSADARDSFCSDGRPCPKKREAVPEAEAQCFAAGGLCATVKRSADVLFEVAAGAQMKLDILVTRQHRMFADHHGFYT